MSVIINISTFATYAAVRDMISLVETTVIVAFVLHLFDLRVTMAANMIFM